MKVNQNFVAKALILVGLLGISVTAKTNPTRTVPTKETSITTRSGSVYTTAVVTGITATATGVTRGTDTTTQ
jgi:hypothetical protein